MIRATESWLYVDDRRWWGDFHTESAGDSVPGITYERRQFIVRFESGWSASVIWGSMTYSDNHDHGLGMFREHPPLIEEPKTVEVGVLFKDQGLIGDPLSYVDSKGLNVVLEAVSHLATGDVRAFLELAQQLEL